MALVLTVGLTACVSEPAVPVASSPSASPVASGEPTVDVPQAPTLVPAGTAADNLPLFDSVVDSVWAGPENVSGRAYVDALVAAGFDKAAMQVTNDLTTIGDRAESIQFSVLWGQECLVGQVGPATGGAVTTIVPALPEGGCLIGQTRPIDW